MKLTTLRVLIGTALLSFGGFANAQIFTSSFPVTASDSDVSNSGKTALAFDFGGANTVNGVNFSSSPTSPVGVTFSQSGFPDGDNNGVNRPAGMSDSYFNVITNLQFNGGGTGDLNFGNLTIGQTYVLQIFAGTNGLGQLGSETVTDGTKTGTLLFDGNGGATDAFYIDDTFIAKSVSKTITLGPPGGTGFILFSAVNLQEVPEPSTYVMMLGGLAVLGLCLRRRRA